MTRYPQYYREYFYIWPISLGADGYLDIPDDMVKFLIKGYELELVGDECTFIVKGSKENVDACVKKYSEFFDSWERIDRRMLTIWDETERLHVKVRELTYFLGDKRGLIDKEKYNEEIDTIIVDLKKLKVV